jgi:hypothetical protein
LRLLCYERRKQPPVLRGSVPSPLVLRNMYGEGMGPIDGIGSGVDAAPNKPMKLTVAFGARSLSAWR